MKKTFLALVPLVILAMGCGDKAETTPKPIVSDAPTTLKGVDDANRSGATPEQKEQIKRQLGAK